MEKATPQTPKQKWDNYWYYYKVHTIIVCFVVAVLGISIYQMATRVNPDYRVILCTADYAGIDTERLGKVMSLLVRDLNGDGASVVEVQDCSFDEQTMDQNAVNAHRTVVLAEIQMDGVFLFICDREKSDWLNYGELFEILGQNPRDTSIENVGWCWKGSGFKAEHFPDAPDELYFCLRRLEGTTFEGKQKAIDRQGHDRELLDSIMNNTMISAEEPS